MNGMVGRIGLGSVGLLLGFFAVAPVSAQVIRGTLVDDDTQEGVEGASVTLLSSVERTISTTLTDSLGSFMVPVADLGAYYLEAQRIGYGTTRSQSFNVSVTDTVHVTFFISTQAIILDPIVVGIPRVLGSELFEKRIATERGVFFTPEMVDSLRPTRHIGEILTHADATQVRWEWGPDESGKYGPRPRVRTYFGREGCLNYIVDRTPVANPWYEGVGIWGASPLADLAPENIVAVEVYRGFFEVPDDFAMQIVANDMHTRRKLRDMQRGECGIVVFWTEEGWGTAYGRGRNR
jgi:hypothetical protein